MDDNSEQLVFYLMIWNPTDVENHISNHFFQRNTLGTVDAKAAIPLVNAPAQDRSLFPSSCVLGTCYLLVPGRRARSSHRQEMSRTSTSPVQQHQHTAAKAA